MCPERDNVRDSLIVVVEEINPLVGEADAFIMATVLQEQLVLEVWGMVVSQRKSVVKPEA